MTPGLGPRVHAAIDRAREELVETRRRLHRHPELAFEERGTALLAAERCAALGYEVSTEVAGSTGVVADLDSGRPGPTVMLRADLDALPIEERAGRPDRRSRTAGVMHACGHDGHVAIALAAGGALAALGDAWCGRVRLCFQPAEEVAGGALPMVGAGVLDGVDRVLGLHLWAPIPSGRVAVTPGALFGSADDFGLVVTGRGGHGGMPHQTVDAVLAAAHVVVALQAIVSRETSPFVPAVVTLGRIEGGTAYNVVAEEVRIRGTVRALADAERRRLLDRIEEVARDAARTLRAEARMERGPGCPPVVSDPESAALVRRAASAVVGDESVDRATPLTVGDDVAYLLERVPGCYFLVGAGDRDGRPMAPHHHPEFDIDESCLAVGAETLTRAALLALAQPGAVARGTDGEAPPRRR